MRTFFPMIIFACAVFQNANSQSIQKISDTFDNSVGLHNLGINNGTVHLNTDQSQNKTHRYYQSDKYLAGSVYYDGQYYANVNLKYDIDRDIIVAKVAGEYNNTGINLITAKTASFQIGNKDFINLNYQNPDTPEFLKGFYELVTYKNDLKLYIKNHKSRINILNEKGQFTNFETSDSFVLFYKNNYFQVRSQNSFIDIFPKLEDKIKNFYQSGRDLEKSDQKQFVKNLLQYIGTFPETEIK